MAGTIDVFTVNTETDLNNAIGTIDSATTPGIYVINFGSSITEGNITSTQTVLTGQGTDTITATVPADLTAINLHSGVSLDINGAGHSLIGTNGTNTFRGLFVYGGTVNVSNLTIQNAVATGGAGGYGGTAPGGGGAGLGGGLFVGKTGTVTLNQVYFSGDKAVGGAGGGSDLANHDNGSYGGGGGLGGAGGGIPSNAPGGQAYGGGGIGRNANGGVISSGGTWEPAGPGIIPAGSPGGTGSPNAKKSGGGAGTGTSPGGVSGGGGGYGYTVTNVNPHAYGGAGGGGLGGHNGTSATVPTGGVGGLGGFGGGGGGGNETGGNGGFGGGGGGGYKTSGKGGWGGGGGGAGSPSSIGGSPGTGGFGGGSGGAGGTSGDYNVGGGGGGGLGAGGDIFVYKGGSLIIQSGTLSGGGVTGGAGGGAGTGGHAGSVGSASGSGIFLYGANQNATFAPGVGQSVTVSDVIIDQQGAEGSGLSTNTGRVVLDGGGELILSAANTFFGGTTLEAGGTLDLNHSGAAGNAGITFGTGFGRVLIQTTELANGGTLANTITNFVAGDAVDLAGLTFSSASASLSNGTLSVTSTSGTDKLLLSASGASFAVARDANGDTAVIENTFTVTSTTDLANDLAAVNVGGVDAFSNAAYIFDFVSSFAIVATQTIDLTSGDSLTLNGGHATTGGGYEIEAGTLIAGTAGAIGSGNVTVDSGATLNVNSFAQTIGDLSGAGAITLGSATLTVGTSNSTTFSGVISGAGTLVKQGSGTLTLTGADSYSGATTITAGELLLGNGGSTGGIASTSTVTGSGTLAFDLTGSISFTPGIGGSVEVVKLAAGTLTLGGSNTYTGGTAIDAGTLVATTDGNLGNASGALTIAGGTLVWNEGASTVSSLRNVSLATGGETIIAAGSGLVTMSGSVSGAGGLTVSGPLTFGGNLSQTGNLLVGSGSITLGGTDSFAGGTTLQAGSLNLGTGSSLPNGGALVVNGGMLSLAGNSETIGALSGTGGSITLGGGALTEGNSTSSSFAGAISGAGALIKQGTGTLTLTAGNAISGGMTLLAGTLELGASASIGSGTIDFGSAAASLRVDAATAPANVVSRFVAGDTIDLHGIAYNAADVLNYSTTTGELNIVKSGSTIASLFFGAGNTLVNNTFAIAQESGGTGIDLTDSVPCFLRGTLIRTPDGEAAVESLAVGDRIVTLSGAVHPIAWIGTGTVQVTRGQRGAATPILLRKSALAKNVPHHDLRITKGHSLFLDDVLIPAEYLVNHRSIQWDDRAQKVEFYHIELARHDVLLANGAPAETYRDDGNRWLFLNHNNAWDQPPKPPCAPVLTGGPIVDAVWRRLLDRAGPRPGVVLTGDPDLHLVCDGARIEPEHGRDGWHSFRLAERPRDVRIVSRAGSPAELGLARDSRVLGVAVRRIGVRQGTRCMLLHVEDAQLSEGFHAYEPEREWRWTDGEALVPHEILQGIAGGCELLLQTAGATQYGLGGRLDPSG
ncbi:MAG TPA: Hint domain-containing protein [Acetobacteraceae bacterium]|jgi:autotransporter-associated beta strand protein